MDGSANKDEPIYFARSAAGDIVHISAVERGLAADCTCAKCGLKLLAAKGERNTHHFRHDAGVDCVGSGETALHILAKQILCAAKAVTLPAYTYVGDDLVAHQLVGAGVMEFDEMAEEGAIGARRADVVATRRGRQLAIEIYRTHLVDQDKTDDFRAVGVSALEIDLSDLPSDISMEALEQWVLHTAPRTWLHNEAVRAQIERLEAAAADDRYAAYKASLEAEISRAEGIKAKIDLHTNIRACYQEFVGLAVAGDHVIAAPNQVWQFQIVKHFVLDQRFVKGGGIFTTRDAVAILQDRISPVLGEQHPTKYLRRLKRDLAPHIATPSEVVKRYLQALAEMGLIYPWFDQVKFKRVWKIDRQKLQEIDPVSIGEKPGAESRPRASAAAKEKAGDGPEASNPEYLAETPPGARLREQALEGAAVTADSMRAKLFLMSYHPAFGSRPYDYVVDETTFKRVMAMMHEVVRRH